MPQMLTLYSFNNWLTRKKKKKDTVLSFYIDGVIQQVLFFLFNCLIFNNYLSLLLCYVFDLLVQTDLCICSSAIWGYIRIEFYIKLKNPQAVKLVPVLEKTFKIEDGVLVSQVSGLSLQTTPDQLMSFLVTKKKTNLSPTNLSPFVSEIKVYLR